MQPMGEMTWGMGIKIVNFLNTDGTQRWKPRRGLSMHTRCLYRHTQQQHVELNSKWEYKFGMSRSFILIVIVIVVLVRR